MWVLLNIYIIRVKRERANLINFLCTAQSIFRVKAKAV